MRVAKSRLVGATGPSTRLGTLSWSKCRSP